MTMKLKIVQVADIFKVHQDIQALVKDKKARLTGRGIMALAVNLGALAPIASSYQVSLMDRFREIAPEVVTATGWDLMGTTPEKRLACVAASTDLAEAEVEIVVQTFASADLVPPDVVTGVDAGMLLVLSPLITDWPKVAAPAAKVEALAKDEPAIKEVVPPAAIAQPPAAKAA